MYKTVEATYRNGYFFPIEPLHVTSSDRVLLTLIPGGNQAIDKGVGSFRGSFKGKLSTVAEFIARKTEEKVLEI